MSLPRFSSSTRRLSSSSSDAAASKLRSHCCFEPPPSLNPVPAPTPRRANHHPSPLTGLRPPSSLDRSSLNPVRSGDLPFDFRFSCTESRPSVRPIGLSEPKYSPFGPGRIDQQRTGVCAPAEKVRVGIGAEVDVKEDEGESSGRILTNAQRKRLVKIRHRGGTKCQVNLGN